MILSNGDASHAMKILVFSFLMAVVAFLVSPFFCNMETREMGMIACSQETFNVLVGMLNRCIGFIRFI